MKDKLFWKVWTLMSIHDRDNEILDLLFEHLLGEANHKRKIDKMIDNLKIDLKAVEADYKAHGIDCSFIKNNIKGFLRKCKISLDDEYAHLDITPYFGLSVPKPDYLLKMK